MQQIKLAVGQLFSARQTSTLSIVEWDYKAANEESGKILYLTRE